MKSHLLAVFSLILIPACSDQESPPNAQPSGREYRDQVDVSHSLLEGAGGAGGDSSGVGGKPECITASDCPKPAGPCFVATCSAGACGEAPLKEGSDLGASFQTPADCKRVVCDGVGNLKSVPEADPADDGDPCTTDVCAAGETLHTITKGAACPGGKCTALGACLECLNGGDCAAGLGCQGGKCVLPQCQNIQKDGLETDVDCGGVCAVCAVGKGCLVGGDCVSSVCVGGICQAPTCSDQQTNGFETDLDCGGPECADCQNGQSCKADVDCAAGWCSVSKKCQAPTCADGVRNGTETGIDCGGFTCPAC